MEINLGAGQRWYVDPPPPRFFWKEIFVGTLPHGIYSVILLYSETTSKSVFFIINSRFVDSSECGSHDFDRPPPSQKIVPARLLRRSVCLSVRPYRTPNTKRCGEAIIGVNVHWVISASFSSKRSELGRVDGCMLLVSYTFVAVLCGTFWPVVYDVLVEICDIQIRRDFRRRIFKLASLEKQNMPVPIYWNTGKNSNDDML